MPRPKNGSWNSRRSRGRQYPAVTRLWENARSEFVAFPDYDVEIRRVSRSTNAIESLNARHWRAVRARWASRWKPVLNGCAIRFDGRINKNANRGPTLKRKLPATEAQ